MIPLPSKQPGYFKLIKGAGLSGWYFRYNCPCGCEFPDIIPVDKAGEPSRPDSHRWQWDGNETHPTITPSLRRTGSPCKIHFNINAGIYLIHSDGAPASADLYKPENNNEPTEPTQPI